MSFADCCIAALARSRQSTLVHKDPEYEQVENEIMQLKLPYKRVGQNSEEQSEV